MVLTVYSVLLLLVLVGGAPWWLGRMLFSARYRAGLAGRLGTLPGALEEAAGRGLAGNGLVWVHAVSVGEVLAVSSVVEALRARGFEVAVSTTTLAGQELAARRFQGCAVFYMPLDFSMLMRRVLRLLRPRLVVTVESELWPNHIHACHRGRIPLAVVNARVSDRSFPRYLWLRRIWGPLLREVSLFLAQSEESAERLRAMGVVPQHIVVTGNLKYDVRIAEVTAIARAVEALVSPERLVVAGSTLAGEEAAVLSAWATVVRGVPDAVLLLAPRHTDRFAEVAGLVAAYGFSCVRCSELVKEDFSGRGPVGGGGVLLLDTIGDLASVYAGGSVAFVGGSLVARGGHNPLEPARFGVPVVMGRSYENFREIVEGMRKADAIRIVEREDLAETLISLLADRHQAAALGGRGMKFFEARAGATERTVEALLRLIGENS